MRGCRCEEEYCTKCFRDRHKKGNMRYHTTFALVYWTEGMKKCMEANEVAVVRGLVFAASATSLSVHAVQTTHEARKELERIREERKEARKEDMAMCVCRPHTCSVGASHCCFSSLLLRSQQNPSLVARSQGWVCCQGTCAAEAQEGG